METALWLFNTPMGLVRKMGTDLLSRACCDGTRGNGFKSEESRFRLDVRKKLFMMRLVKYWKILSRETVESPYLEAFNSG